MIAIILGSAVATPLLASGSSGKQSEGLGIQGGVTITLYGPAGQTLGVWKTHNSLVFYGAEAVADCMSGLLAATCPQSGTSLTGTIALGIGSCTTAFSVCGVFAAATNSPLCSTPLPYGGEFSLECAGWIATASFGPSALNCASTCTVNDVASGITGATGSSSSSNFGAGQFDDIPSINFPSAITFVSGDSLSINIQFTVS